VPYSLVYFNKKSNTFCLIVDAISVMIMIVIMKMTTTVMIK